MSAASIDEEGYQARAVAHLKAGRHAEADAEVRAWLAEPLTPSERLAPLHLLAAIQFEARLYADAEGSLRAALALRERLASPAEALARTHHTLGDVLAAQGRHLEAIDRFQEALAGLTQTYGANSLEVCATVANLGSSLMALRRFGEGEPYLAWALTIARAQRDELTLARLLCVQAQVQASLGHPDGAATAAEALSLVRAQGVSVAVDLARLVPMLELLAARDDDPTKPRGLERQLRMAASLIQQGAFTEAEQVLVSALTNAKNQGDLPQEAWASGMMAHALKQLGRITEALPHAMQALNLARALVQPEAVAQFEALVASLRSREP